jgi:hypothetical protein
MMAIAAGYEDADDLDALRHDPALMIACERAPETGRSIPSQPTISRLEDLADTRTLYKIGTGFIDLFCRSYARAPASIALDIDDTDDMVHGQQELALFNTHAGGTCFKPIHIFEAGSGKPILSLLRPGKRPSGEEIARVLAHVIYRIRRRWPKVAILVRGDGHYCAPEVLNLLRKTRCDYILGLPRNKTLDALAAPWREQCGGQSRPLGSMAATASQRIGSALMPALHMWKILRAVADQEHRLRPGAEHHMISIGRAERDLSVRAEASCGLQSSPPGIGPVSTVPLLPCTSDVGASRHGGTRFSSWGRTTRRSSGTCPTGDATSARSSRGCASFPSRAARSSASSWSAIRCRAPSRRSSAIWKRSAPMSSTSTSRSG